MSRKKNRQREHRWTNRVLTALLLVVGVSTATAQQPPSAVGDLRHWYDVTQFGVHNTTGSAVTNDDFWPDQSSGGRHLGQGPAPGSNDLTYREPADSTLNNNLPAFRMLSNNPDGTGTDSDPFGRTGLTNGQMPAHTMMMVGNFFDVNNVTNGHAMFVGQGNASSRMGLWVDQGAGQFGMFTQNAGVGNAYSDPNSWTRTPSGTQILTYTYPGGGAVDVGVITRIVGPVRREKNIGGLTIRSGAR